MEKWGRRRRRWPTYSKVVPWSAPKPKPHRHTLPCSRAEVVFFEVRQGARWPKTRHCSSAPFLLLSKFQAAALSRLTPTHQQPANDMSDEMKRSGLRSPNSSYHIQMSPDELRHFGTAWLLQLPMDSSGSSCRAFCIPRKKIGDGGRWEGMMHHHVLGLATRAPGAAWTRETALCFIAGCCGRRQHRLRVNKWP